jgi:2-polyprenyl-3-methyl-5-hydroxy-6-metoxy-1,4-benzoquinol methylase
MWQTLFLGLSMLTSQIDALNCQCYNAKAHYWDRFPFPEHLPRFFWQHYKPSLGKKMLDIGSGTGRVAAYFKESGFEVTCLDPSDEMVRLCREKGLTTVQSTLQAFQTEEKFGVVVAILSLIHVPKAEFMAQIEKIQNCLESEGVLILSMLKGSSEQLEEQKGGFPRFFARYTAEEVRGKLASQFTEIAYHEQGDYMLFFFKQENHLISSKLRSFQEYSP